MHVAQLKSAIDLADQNDAVERGDDGLPTAFRLLRFGVNDSKNGPINLDEKGAAEVMRRYSAHGIKLAVDWEHQTFSSEQNGQPAPAIGWVHPEVRPDGLWAVVDEWTAQGAEMLRSKSYRYFSPVVGLEPKTNRVISLMPIALTNHPALSGLSSLTLRPNEDKNMDEALIAKLRAADGFAGEVLKLTGKETHQAAMGTIATWQASHERVEKLTAELKGRDERDRKALLDSLHSSGKLEKESKLRAYAESLDLAALTVLAEALPQIVPVGAPIKQNPAPTTMSRDALLSAAEKAIDDEMKTDPSISPAVAMQRATTKNSALFAEGSTTNEGA